MNSSRIIFGVGSMARSSVKKSLAHLYQIAPTGARKNCHTRWASLVQTAITTGFGRVSRIAQRATRLPIRFAFMFDIS